MTDKSVPNNKEINKGENLNFPGQTGEWPELLSDPDYLALVENYQQAQFSACNELLKNLFVRYPAHPRLIEFQKDLDVQLSLRHLEVTHINAEKKQRTKKTLKLSAFTIFSIAVILVIFAGSYVLLSQLLSQEVSESTTSQAALLEQQANDLLNTGQPKVAAGLVEQIRSIDPGYAGLTNLEQRTNELLALEAKYEIASGLLDEEKNTEALLILQEIETQSPGLWDVRKLITDAETGVQIKELMVKGDAAYQEESWQESINAYETALALNPDLDDSLMKEQLLNSYLKRIIQMLESNSATIEEIETAEQYYRKAVAMIPQSRAFASERGNLQRVSSNLLELKFTQTANVLLQERYQTFASISRAVSYLNKAVNLNPKNVELQQALKNAQLYQVAFQNVLDMNWTQAIKNLSQIVDSEPDYANGNARQLLYDAYYSLGIQYYAVGLYTDARTNLEQAEILAFDEGDNKLQLFQVQMALGDTIAKMEDYENAVSYYQYAVNTINVYSRIPVTSDLYDLLVAAEGLAAQGDFQLSAESYHKVKMEIPQIYTMQTVEAPDGTTLPFFAIDHHSTTEAIIDANNLPQSMVITFGRELQVPTIE